MKLLSLFSGIGAFEKALQRQNIPYELVGFSEIDKYAITAYCAIHGVDESLNLGDITKIDLNKVPDCDIITHGSPCQSFSVAGKGDGGNKGSGTRSSLMWYTVEIVKHKLPKYVIWENVKGVLSKKHKHNFDQYLNELEKLGYNNYYEVLNSKDYGIPQNRERIYVISIRKDIDKGNFEFPEPFDNGLRLKDLLEDEVEEKYYINNEKAEKLIKELKDKEFSNTIRVGGRGSVDRHQWDLVCVGNVNPSGKEISSNVYSSEGLSPTLTANKVGSKIAIPCLTPDRINKRQNGRRFKTDGEPMFTLTAQDRHGVLVNEPNELKQIGSLESSYEQSGRVYSPNGTAPTVMGNNRKSTTGGYNAPKIIESIPKRLGGLYDKGGSRHQAGSVWDKEGIAPTLDTMQGGCREPLIIDENKLKFVGGLGEKDWARDGKKLSRNYPQGERVYDSEGIACSQTSQGGGTGSYTGLYLIDYRIRKLTPLECWRLMDFDDEDYWKARRALEEKYYNGRDRSNSQMYKMAGNSITVGVLELIFKNLFI